MGRVGTELTRKLVHIGMGGFALALRWMTPVQALGLTAAALLFNLFVLNRLTGRSLLRDGEREWGFSWGIALYPAVLLVTVVVFHERLELAAAVWALLAFGDGMAAVVGILLGGPRLPWNRNKTWTGFVAFVLYGTATSALLVRWTQRAVHDAAGSGADVTDYIGSSFLALTTADAVLPDVLFLIFACAAAALAAGFAESVDTAIDDNVRLALVGGAVLYGASLVEPSRLVAAADFLRADLLLGAAINGVLAALVFALRAVGVSGAVWGWVLATLLYGFGGWPAFLMLALLVALGTVATRLGNAKKTALGVAQEHGGRRGARHAFANSTVGVAFAFLAVGTAYPEACAIALVAAFATAAGDTAASEIGQAYGRRHVLVTTGAVVPAGTEGAVSIEGTLAGTFASAVLAVTAWQVGLISGAGAGIVVVAAFAGGTFESYVGAMTKQPGPFDNELLNFANTLVGAAVALALFVLWPTVRFLF